MSRADAVYCHTEVEYLAVAAVLPRHGGPILAGQTIWIFHRFASLPVLRRRLVRRLIRRVDLLIANAEPNVELGRAIAPAAVHRYLPFGISRAFASDDRRPGSPQVLGVGNDAARDWDVFAHAVEDAGVVDVRVASKAPVHVRGTDVAVATSGLAELRELYATSALVLLAARENAHASGITTLLEAAAAGTPVVATRTGGLDAYFTDDEVAFVEPGSRDALSAAVRRDLADPAARERRGRAAREAMDRSALWNDCYWRRVVDELSGLPLGSRP
ncbi:hypothetical protein GCM10025881_02600 [Pseudolysinimonas kribbensis]|uniref:Glycosyl transferase family 1 domain-containing protein n=1 Tax=Pseudolysinimonas kribbensis TaxID=433641 RepID=A0ABQ6K0X4_9MICO|nr:glycosyltransferase [Pseudolysinimonas kribbensis]GMA93436.1 hypothetical protein GCM10025881_02600 [Pseudolysinimonas kribbensis]